MRIGFVSDVHVANHRLHGGPVVAGLNRRCRQTLDVLRLAVTRAKEQRCEALFVLGDLFDTTRPEPQVIAAAQQAFTGMTVYAMLGNHEHNSTAPGDHALGPLHNHDMIEVIEQPVALMLGGVWVLCVPFRPGNPREWLSGVLDILMADVSQRNTATHHSVVLALHMGLIGGDTPPWLRGSGNAIEVETLRELCRQHGIVAVLSGDWHERKEHDPRFPMLQVGGLAPTGWDNPGLTGYGTLAVWDSERGLSWKELPGPRFLNLKLGESLPPVGGEGYQLYVRFKVDPAKVSEARADAVALVDAGLVAAGEVVLDDAEVQAATRAAARAATTKESADEALAAYVEEMSLDDGVDRKAVLERCREFLR